MNTEPNYRENILVCYLVSHIPVPVGKENEYTIYKTSQEIQDELSEMVCLSLNEIAKYMIGLGYNIVIREDNRPYWTLEELP